jgi:hypothetical protein
MRAGEVLLQSASACRATDLSVHCSPLAVFMWTRTLSTLCAAAQPCALCTTLRRPRPSGAKAGRKSLLGKGNYSHCANDIA